MIGRVVKIAVTTKTGRKVGGKAVKTAVATKAGRKAARLGAKSALKAGRGAGKIGGKAGKGAGKAALVGAKAKGQSGLAKQALGSQEPASKRFLKYGIFAVAGFAIGALAARSSGNDGADSSFTGGTGHHTPDPDSPAGRRGETWGSGTPLGTPPGGPAGGPPPPPPGGPQPGGPVGGPPPSHQRPEDPNRTGAEREYSDPSSGPLIGEHHESGVADIPEQQEEVEQRIRTRIGEDPRTLGLERLNIEVNDGVADIRGIASSDDVKSAIAEIAAGTEGVREVRNLVTIS